MHLSFFCGPCVSFRQGLRQDYGRCILCAFVFFLPPRPLYIYYRFNISNSQNFRQRREASRKTHFIVIVQTSITYSYDLINFFSRTWHRHTLYRIRCISHSLVTLISDVTYRLRPRQENREMHYMPLCCLCASLLPVSILFWLIDPEERDLKTNAANLPLYHNFDFIACVTFIFKLNWRFMWKSVARTWKTSPITFIIINIIIMLVRIGLYMYDIICSYAQT